MYSQNNNSNHPDPFAGQYPPPPPLQERVAEYTATPSPAALFPEPSYNHHQPIYSTMPLPPPPPPPVISPPQPQMEIYDPRPVANDYYQHQSYGHNLDEERQVQGVNDYDDPNGQSLDEYLRQERNEYFGHGHQATSYNNESSPTAAATPPTRPNQVTPSNTFTNQDYQQAEMTPMVQNPIKSKKEQKKLDKMQRYEPHIARPTLAPENEAETYKYRPQQEKRDGGCNCCCYNPAITCCSFFCLLISCAFVAAGIAMVIASKVVSDKCSNQCSSVAEAAQQACGTLCNTVLHDGLLYGGIVVAGLAGIAVIWKLIMWTCAGYSKH